MNEVTRFKVGLVGDEWGGLRTIGLIEDPEGKVVLASEYEKLERQYDAIRENQPRLGWLEFRKLASEAFGEVVDYDLMGNPITDYSTLTIGAYSPAIRRLVDLAVARYAPEPNKEIDTNRPDQIVGDFVILDCMAFSKVEILEQRVAICDLCEMLIERDVEIDRLRAQLDTKLSNRPDYEAADRFAACLKEKLWL